MDIYCYGICTEYCFYMEDGRCSLNATNVESEEECQRIMKERKAASEFS